nr:ankyrin repeat domain-containing protein [Candidatus Dependentiae bacterium]
IINSAPPALPNMQHIVSNQRNKLHLDSYFESHRQILSPNKTTILTCSFFGKVMLWDAATKLQLHSFGGISAAVVNFNFDGTQIITGSAEGMVQCWNTRTRQLLEEHKTGNSPICSIDFQQDTMRVKAQDGKSYFFPIQKYFTETRSSENTIASKPTLLSIPNYSYPEIKNTPLNNSQTPELSHKKPSQFLSHVGDSSVTNKNTGILGQTSTILNANPVRKTNSFSKVAAEKAQNTTQLIEAFLNGNLQEFERLLNKGADINALSSQGYSCLNYAALSKSPQDAQYLIERGADLYSTSNEGNTNLHFAAMYNKKEMLQFLIEKGLDPHAKSNCGNTCLHFAASKNTTNVFQFLLDKGLDIYAKNKVGATCLHMAAMKNTKEMIQFLLDKGFNIYDNFSIYDKDNAGYTCLHKAAMHNTPEVIQFLRDKGLDLYAKNNAGATCLHLANSREVIQFLIKEGLDIYVKDNKGLTCLDYARNNKDPDVYKFLQDIFSISNDLKTKTLRAENRSQELKGSDAAITSIAFCPDGKTVLTGSGDQSISMGNLITRNSSAESNKISEKIKSVDRITSIAFCPNGKTVLTRSNDQTISMWDPLTGNSISESKEITEETKPVVSIEQWETKEEKALEKQFSLLLRVEELIPSVMPIEEENSISSRKTTQIEQPNSSTEKWHLTFFLQSIDNPQLTLSAREIWTQTVSSQEGVTSYENLQNCLSNHLLKASNIFKKFTECLQEQSPSFVELTTHEVYRFLKQEAQLLLTEGISIQIPACWNNVHNKISPKVFNKTVSRKDLSGIVDYDWKLSLGEHTVSEEEFKQLLTLQEPLVKVDGTWMLVDPKELTSALLFIKQKRTANPSFAKDLKLSLLEKEKPSLVSLQRETPSTWFEELTSRLKNPQKMASIKVPLTLKGTLRPYQERGLTWLSYLHENGLGACLADDMGLGKTIQTIALLLHQKESGTTTAPHLLVCPLSVLSNWKNEIATFAPSLKVMVHHGAQRLSSESFKNNALLHDLVITTYALCSKDCDELRSLPWQTIILDEAQNIKNSTSKQTGMIKSLQSQNKLALTGTPIENRLGELWSILDFLNKGYLGSEESFHTTFTVPIEKDHNQEKAEALKKLVQPFILRRVKTDKKIINDLPEKTEIKELCNLTLEQATLYQKTINEMLNTLNQTNGSQRNGIVFSTIMRLKQICNHPAHLLDDNSSLKDRSGKVARLEELLEEILAKKEKSLIFTQFSKMGKLLQKHLADKYKQKVLFLCGSTPQHERESHIEEFQKSDGPLIFILSLKAGGTGINLTRANHVFHFDRGWNPAAEDQATDRAFRIGQKNQVLVHKFICTGTIEEKIDALLERKKQLATLALHDGDGWITSLSSQEITELFSLSVEPSTALSNSIIISPHIAQKVIQTYSPPKPCNSAEIIDLTEGEVESTSLSPTNEDHNTMYGETVQQRFFANNSFSDSDDEGPGFDHNPFGQNYLDTSNEDQNLSSPISYFMHNNHENENYSTTEMKTEPDCCIQ